MNKKKRSFFKMLWNFTVKICQQAQIPLYVERHDPKIFTTVQKIFLCLYKLKKRLTLRGLIDDLSTSKVVEFLHLPRIPNFSTLSYFVTTLPSNVLAAVDDAVQQLLPSFDGVIIDSTGFECTYPSHYYCRRINSPYPVDGFITLHALIDQENGFVRTHKTSVKKIHDSRMLRPLVRKLHRKPAHLYADRGYDSEENYRFLVEEIDCVPLILQKNILKPLHKCKGEHRREMRAVFDYGEYLKRNKIEAIFSSIKRKYGCALSTRKTKTQRKEVTLKIILYNIEKKLRIILIIIFRRKTFQQSPNMELIRRYADRHRTDFGPCEQNH